MLNINNVPAGKVYIFRPYRTINGRRVSAKDFGLKAWKILVDVKKIK